MFFDRTIRRKGIPAEATVTSMTPRKSHQDCLSRKYDYVLEIRSEKHPFFVARVTLYAAYLGAKPQEYDEVRVKYDPKTMRVVFDLVGDERFDTDAMNARSARLRKETHEMLLARKSGSQNARGSFPTVVIRTDLNNASRPGHIERSDAAMGAGAVRNEESGVLSPELFRQLQHALEDLGAVRRPQ